MISPYVACTDVTERVAIAQANGFSHDVDASARLFQPFVISVADAMACTPALTLPNIKASVSNGMRPTIRTAWGTLGDTWVDAGGNGVDTGTSIYSAAR